MLESDLDAYEEYRGFFLGSMEIRTDQLSGVSVLMAKGFLNWLIHRHSKKEIEMPCPKNIHKDSRTAPASQDDLVLLLATLIGGGMNNR